jgi:hypothetical protein
MFTPFFPFPSRRHFGLTLIVALAASALSGAESPRVDSSTLTGKVMCGYQGWFNAEGDGAQRGYNHWSRGGARPAPGNVRVDLWPDLAEFPADERFPTDFKHADGTPAEVFSSYRRPTVLRHFEWMREHGIDGVFIQRFINSLTRETRSPPTTPCSKTSAPEPRPTAAPTRSCMI